MLTFENQPMQGKNTIVEKLVVGRLSTLAIGPGLIESLSLFLSKRSSTSSIHMTLSLPTNKAEYWSW